MRSLYKSDNAPHNIAPVSNTAETFSTVIITNSTGTNPSVKNNLLYIKCLVALAGLNNLETQDMNPDIAELANVFNTMLNSN